MEMEDKKEVFLAVENYRNRSLGTLIRCASAFGATAVIAVGSSHFSTHGAHGAQRFLPQLHFHYWSDCVAFLKERGCTLYAFSPTQKVKVEEEQQQNTNTDTNTNTAMTSRPISEVHFNSSLAFLLGPKNNLTSEIISYCDEVLHVPLPDAQCELLVHYDAKLSLALQQAAVQLLFTPTAFRGGKHDRQLDMAEKNLIPIRTRRVVAVEQQQRRQHEGEEVDNDNNDNNDSDSGGGDDLVQLFHRQPYEKCQAPCTIEEDCSTSPQLCKELDISRKVAAIYIPSVEEKLSKSSNQQIV
eukprot:gene775-840_t